MTTKKIALFIDADNISAKFGKQIIDTLNRRGEIFIRRIYGNWEKFSLHGWNDCILNLSLRPVQQTDFAAGKNATDMSLTIDAMDVLHDGRAEIFALVSNDSDFTPLAIRLREGGMMVLGIGNSRASSSFRSACSEFIDLDMPVQIVQPAQSSPKVEKKSATVKKSSAEKNSSGQLSLFEEPAAPEAPETKTAPQKKFQPKRFPVPRSSKVVPITAQKMSLQERFILCKKNGLRQPKKKLQQLHKILQEAAAAHSDESGFSKLNHAGQEIREKNLGYGIRDFGYIRLRDFVADFPDLYETTKFGQTLRYRCK